MQSARAVPVLIEPCGSIKTGKIALSFQIDPILRIRRDRHGRFRLIRKIGSKSGVLAIGLMWFLAASAQEAAPPSGESGILELPSLEEELGALAPWRQPAPDAAQAPPAETEAERLGKTVRLNGLDKITGRIMGVDAPADQPVMFGSLQITARACHKRPPEEPPETSAYLEIADFRQASSRNVAQVNGRPMFSGWMFASSPALSALEHPIYDVWVIDCITRSPPQTSGSE